MEHKNKPNFRRILTAALALLLAVLMVLPLLLSALSRAGAATSTEQEVRDKIAALQQEASAVKSERASLQEQLDAVKGQTSQALAEKRIRDQELAAIDKQIDNTEQQIAYYDDLIAQYDAVIAQYDDWIAQEEVNLADAQDKADRQFELFCKRVRASEEQGTVSYLSIIFSASSFSDMLDLFTIVSDTIDYDNAVIDQLRADRQAVAETLASLNEYREDQAAQKAEQEEQRAEQAAKKDELEEQRAEQAALVAESTALVNEYLSQQATYEQLMDAEEASAAAIEKQIAAAEAELDQLIREQQIAAGDGYVWPVPGCYTLTSAYGYRTHPITGEPYKLHNGIDIAASKNTPIHAVKGGVVTISGWDDSYGNYVVVSHGDGNSSLYAHMNKRAVKAGDVVEQDQVIGYVGMTGSANGYHLHLEIRVNSQRVDPHDIFVDSVPFRYASTYNKNAEKP